MTQQAQPTLRSVKVPGPDHPIEITTNPNRVVVTFGGRTIASTRRALTLRESTYPAVQYIPRQDVDMSLLDRASPTTYCPYKGECNYFNLAVNGEHADASVWTYEAPFAAVSQIKDHLAFYPDRVDAIDEIP